MYNVHDDLKDKTVEELKVISDNDRLPYAICFLNLEYDNNIGNGIRSAHILGAKKVLIFGKNKVDTRSTVGAHNYIDYVRYNYNDFSNEKEMTDNFLSMCYSNKIFPIFIDKTYKSKNLDNFNKIIIDYNNHEFRNDFIFCFVFGNEKNGIPECLINTTNEVYHLEQRGVIRSLNVASAAAITMYHVSKYLKH
jgi:tRNA(Leu) C34 or U34 (ribose-2'-O)-methylase TrmL